MLIGAYPDPDPDPGPDLVPDSGPDPDLVPVLIPVPAPRSCSHSYSCYVPVPGPGSGRGPVDGPGSVPGLLLFLSLIRVPVFLRRCWRSIIRVRCQRKMEVRSAQGLGHTTRNFPELKT